jgi:hypothetical protein
VSDERHIAWAVLETQLPIRWGCLESLKDITYTLVALYWDAEKRLLYINSSDNRSVYEDVAKAVCGDDVQRVSGEIVYRAMADIKRLVPTNVGLLDTRSTRRRFSMHVGADVTEGFPAAEAQTKTKTNIFAYGFDGGSRVSIGGSLKGRIWSYRIASGLQEWSV